MSASPVGPALVVDLRAHRIDTWPQLWQAVVDACELPPWFGHNLDAWADALDGGGISPVLDAASDIVVRLSAAGLFGPDGDGRAFIRATNAAARARVVLDRQPPRTMADDGGRTTLRTLLQYQRESVVRKVEDVDDEAARRSPVPSGTSLLWLVQHLAQAERTWVLLRFAGLDETAAGLHVETATVADAVSHYRQTWSAVDAIVDRAGLDDVCRGTGVTPPVDLRWVLAHLLEETARHAGHADVLRELIDGMTGR